MLFPSIAHSLSDGTTEQIVSLLRIAATCLIAHVALSVYLIPRYQLAGVVIAVVATALLAFVLAGIHVRKNLHMRVGSRSLAS